jgi:hypothetical protein
MGDMFRIRPVHIVTVIQGTVLIMSLGFSALFVIEMAKTFVTISSTSTFFGSANTIMYLTIEGLFLCLILFATYITLKSKEYQD